MRIATRQWYLAATAGLGAAGLSLAGVVAPAGASDTTPEATADPRLAIRSAVDPASALADDPSSYEPSTLDLAARRAGISVRRLEEMIRTDNVHVTPEGVLGYADDIDGSAPKDDAPRAAAATRGVAGDPESGSRPDAPYTVYIDFDGATLENTVWNRRFEEDVVELVGDDAASDPDYVHEVWARVAEDFAPLNINVTTTDPGTDALVKSSEDDTEYGTTVVVTDSEEYSPSPTTGGLGYFGFGTQFYSAVLVFAPIAWGNAPAAVGNLVSHEAGHSLFLEHHGIDDEEYAGTYPQEPESLWAPLMGGSMPHPLTQWSMGDYAGATNPEQDDLATMTDPDGAYRTFVLYEQDGDFWNGGYCTYADDPQNPGPEDQLYKPTDGACDIMGEPLISQFSYAGTVTNAADDHGDQRDDATSLSIDSGEFAAEGVIGASADVDVFELPAAGGAVTVSAAPADVASNLDIKLTLVDADGHVVGEDDPAAAADLDSPESDRAATGLTASIEADVAEGVHYLVVDGVGHGDPADNTPRNGAGYSDYGSLGHYQLSGTPEPEAVEPDHTANGPAPSGDADSDRVLERRVRALAK